MFLGYIIGLGCLFSTLYSLNIILQAVWLKDYSNKVRLFTNMNLIMFAALCVASMSSMFAAGLVSAWIMFAIVLNMVFTFKMIVLTK